MGCSRAAEPPPQPPFMPPPAAMSLPSACLQRLCSAPYRAPELWDVPSSCTISTQLRFSELLGSCRPAVAAQGSSESSGTSCRGKPPPSLCPLFGSPVHTPQTSASTSGPWAASSTFWSAAPAPLSAPPARRAAASCWRLSSEACVHGWLSSLLGCLLPRRSALRGGLRLLLSPAAAHCLHPHPAASCCVRSGRLSWPEDAAARCPEGIKCVGCLQSLPALPPTRLSPSQRCSAQPALTGRPPCLASFLPPLQAAGGAVPGHRPVVAAAGGRGGRGRRPAARRVDAVTSLPCLHDRCASVLM